MIFLEMGKNNLKPQCQQEYLNDWSRSIEEGEKESDL